MKIFGFTLEQKNRRPQSRYGKKKSSGRKTPLGTTDITALVRIKLSLHSSHQRKERDKRQGLRLAR